MSVARNYFHFLWRCVRTAASGDWRYWAWLGALLAVGLVGLHAYVKQLEVGLVTTDLTNQVPWGIYIANFTFLLGVAGAATVLVIPVYLYKNRNLSDLIIYTVVLGVASLLMALLFLTADLGRPDKLMHIMPGFVPTARVIALTGFLLLNLHIVAYLLFCHYRKVKPTNLFYVPFIITAIVWGIVLHTVTAFLIMGLGNTPFWNQAIIGPRFIASAFVAAPAFIVLMLKSIHRVCGCKTNDRIVRLLRGIMEVAMIISMFLLANEFLRNLFRGSAEGITLDYLYFGMHGLSGLVPLVGTALVLNLIALVILVIPFRRSMQWISIASVCSIIGIWIEKSMGLVVPGFLPTPLGEMVRYVPTLNETLVSVGIWAFGLLVLSVLLRVTIPILQGKITQVNESPVAKPVLVANPAIPLEPQP
jgi:Ni/Fe-hydrogenase subunit HybB-like protein